MTGLTLSQSGFSVRNGWSSLRIMNARQVRSMNMTSSISPGTCYKVTSSLYPTLLIPGIDGNLSPTINFDLIVVRSLISSGIFARSSSMRAN